jgi:9-cis-epoxycarotenoid dioxygenase
MMAFGYNVEAGKGGKEGAIHYSVINKDRKVTSNVTIPISSPRMIHDFAITENYAIFPDLPMEMRPDLMIKESKFIFHFDEKKPARYGIMKRHCLNPDQVQWFELPNHYVFHFVNAWEDVNENGDQIIRLFGCT